MRLRHRLLGLFGVFAVLPLLAIGALGYVRSLRSLEALVEVEAIKQVDRLATSLRDRVDHMESDISLLAGNDETQRILEALAASDTSLANARRPSAERYLEELWSTMRHGYDRIAITDNSRRTILSRSDSLWAEGVMRRGAPASIVRAITSTNRAQRLGEVQVEPRIAELFPSRELQEGFGQRRMNLVLDRDAGLRVLAGGGGPDEQPRVPASIAAAPLAGSRGTFRYDEAGDRRIAAFVNFDGVPWTVLATASVTEFAAPFLRQRLVDLGLLLLVVVGVSVGFFLLLRRTTRPLDQLAAAATRVGQGDLSPELPRIAPDEIGHLTKAFGDMAVRVREMLAQVEASRQTAVLGRFAVELAHEIRNPLTSVKLNLQGLARDGRDGRIPHDSQAAVAMALREIRRIDEALRAALRAGRPLAERQPYDVRLVLDEATALLRAEADAARVRLESHWHATTSGACGDAEAMRGVFVNLFLNAIQAVGGHRVDGGAVDIEARDARLVDGAPAVEVRIRDDGPGIPAELRDRVFHPFFTTRDSGTGLGLSVALQAVQAMGGTLRLGDSRGSGAELIVTVPVSNIEGTPT